MACTSGCFEALIQSCTDNILVKAGLDANTSYYWIIDFRGNRYQRIVETDGEGVLTIDVSQLPSGINKYSPALRLQLRTGVDYLDAVVFQFGGEEYDCVLIKFTDIGTAEGDESPVNVIQFTGSITPGGVVDPNIFEARSADFTAPGDPDTPDATHYNNDDIVGEQLVIFWNNANRYLLANEWEATATGINVLAEGFDAINIADTYLIIYIKNT